MAKGQRRGNKEFRKPKTKKEAPATPAVVLGKGLSAAMTIPNKKRKG